MVVATDACVCLQVMNRTNALKRTHRSHVEEGMNYLTKNGQREVTRIRYSTQKRSRVILKR